MVHKIHTAFPIIIQLLVKHAVLVVTTEKSKFNNSYRVI